MQNYQLLLEYYSYSYRSKIPPTIFTFSPITYILKTQFNYGSPNFVAKLLLHQLPGLQVITIPPKVEAKFIKPPTTLYVSYNTLQCNNEMIRRWVRTTTTQPIPNKRRQKKTSNNNLHSNEMVRRWVRTTTTQPIPNKRRRRKTSNNNLHCDNNSSV